MSLANLDYVMAFVALFIIFGVVYSVRAIWKWAIANREVNSELVHTVAAQTQDLEEERNINLKNHKMVELGALAGGIGHEILNPVTSAMMSLGMLETNLAKNPIPVETVNKNLNRLKQSLVRVAKIVKGLKNIARDADNDPFEKTRLAEIWSNIEDIATPKFKDLGIELRSAGFAEDKFLECSPIQIEQAIINLLNNAIDAIETSENGWVEVSVEDANEGKVIFRITDSGTGIPKEIVERMFEPLYTTKPAGKGTGLGLALIQKIMDKHNGRFWYNHESKNTQFCFELPIVQSLHIEDSSSSAVA